MVKEKCSREGNREDCLPCCRLSEGGLCYGKADSEKADFYIQRTDGSGDAFYSPDIQCGIPESIV